MTLIIAGVEEGNPDLLTVDHGFCVGDGRGTRGRGIFSDQREKIHLLAPQVRIGTGDRGARGYESGSTLRRLIVAHAGDANLTAQIVNKFSEKLRELYVCYREIPISAEDENRISALEKPADKILCLRHTKDKSIIRHLPTHEDLPGNEQNPELSMGYAALLLDKTFAEVLSEVLSHDAINATSLFINLFSEFLLLGMDWPNRAVRLFKFSPSPVCAPDRPPSVSVSTTEILPGHFGVIGLTEKFRSRLARGLGIAVHRGHCAPKSLARLTLVKVCGCPRTPAGVGGKIREATIDFHGVEGPHDVNANLPRLLSEKNRKFDWQ